jgi:hypothetical protein
VEFRNISTRVAVEMGDRVGIAGFILRGDSPKRVIVRGLGPSLKSGGTAVEGRLNNPTLELHDKDGALVASNDDWQTSDNRAEIEASGLAPKDEREAAILREIGSGPHTAVIRGVNGSSGIGLVEVYDLNDTSNSDLANVSTRARVETADEILIGGFIVRGDTPQRMVIRALGPSLSGRAVPDALQNPTLELRDSNGDLIVSNDDWRDSQEAEIRATGLEPSDQRESAVVRTLGAGAYTAIVRGLNDTTGIGLVEAYNLGAP